MTFKCNNCGYPYLSGKEKDCPKCHLAITYRCINSNCGKELLDGPPRLCPSCQKEKELEAEKKKKKILDVIKWIVPIASLLYVPCPDIIPLFPGDDIAVVIVGTIITIGLWVWASSVNKKMQEFNDGGESDKD